MMGTKGGDQDRLFYSFNLDKHVPAEHLLRRIDRFLDLSELRRHLEPYYSHTGRPSVDPELMIRMLLVGYCFGIRSERRLCEEVHLNLAYRWFCRLGLEDVVPEHSTFSKNRHGRFRDSDAFRHVFETVLQRCIAERLVGGEGFAVDASVVTADASRVSGFPGTELASRKLDDEQATRAVREYLAGVDEEASRRAEADRRSISATDPAAEWTCAPGGPAFFAYSTNYLIDVQAGVIVDVEATSAHRTQEVDATRTMLERTEERFALKPKHLIGDMAYGSGPMLGWLVETKQIEPHIPVWDKSDRADGTIASSDFVWNEAADEYRFHKAVPCAGSGARSASPGPTSPRLRRSSTGPDRPTARRVRSSPAAARTRRSARSPAACMRRRVMSLAASPRPVVIVSHAGIARRSRCCSLTSSGS